MPKIVQIEICYPKLNENSELGKELRFQTTNRIISMLDVRFTGDSDEEREQDKCLAMSEFGTFLRGFNLTSQEVIEAYRMALSKNFNYKVYPTLSLIQAGEILEIYQEYKRNSYTRNSTLKKLNESLNSSLEHCKDHTEHENGALKRVFEDLKSTGYSDNCHFLFKELEKNGKLRNWDKKTKIRFFEYVKNKFIEERKNKYKLGMISFFSYQILKDEKAVNTLVKYICREIFVSNYLKKHLKSFETFIKSIKN